MRINSFKIRNFQAFEETKEIELSESINLIIGQNNSGKSSILRSLNSSINPDFHVSNSGKKSQPRILMDIKVDTIEFFDGIKNNNKSYTIKSPIDPIFNDAYNSVEYFFNNYKEINFRIENRPHSSFQLEDNNYNYFQKFSLSPESGIGTLNIRSEDGDTYCKFQIIPYKLNMNDDTSLIIGEIWHRKFFNFIAERLNISQCTLEHTQSLAPDARNLPSLLHTLRGERGSVLNNIISQLKEIITSVGNISTVLVPNRTDMVEIRVWPTEDMDGLDRSFSLSQSGAGISQVLAILCAVATSNNSVIAIDEIDTFLHPAAVKSLLRIIQTEYKNHQYIITTHSPEVISFSNPNKVFLVKREGYSSSIDEVDVDDINTLRDASNHLGVSMNDVFAANRIIWVEGQTEELCFPWIYRKICNKKLPIGTFFTAVVSTGSFLERRKDKNLVYDIYDKLTKAISSYTESTVFSFDTEELSDQDQSEMKRTSKDAIRFLPRRMLECYVLNPEAIKNLIHFRNPDYCNINASLVEKTIINLSNTVRGLGVKGLTPDIHSNEWVKNVHAAKLISNTLDELTNSTVTFQKTRDVIFLLENISLIDPESLLELYQYVENLVDFS